jgi:hypothetical protein
MGAAAIRRLRGTFSTPQSSIPKDELNVPAQNGSRQRLQGLALAASFGT